MRAGGLLSRVTSVDSWTAQLYVGSDLADCLVGRVGLSVRTCVRAN